MESTIFFRNRKLGVVEKVPVSELYLLFRTGEVVTTSFQAQWNAAKATNVYKETQEKRDELTAVVSHCSTNSVVSSVLFPVLQWSSCAKL